MSKKTFKEQLRVRNVPADSVFKEEFGNHFDSNRSKKGWSGAYGRPTGKIQKNTKFHKILDVEVLLPQNMHFSVSYFF